MATESANQANPSVNISTDAAPGGDLPAGSDSQQSPNVLPRLIEEHHVLGPYGEDEIEATDDRGRRWFQLRPEPRRRVDLIGFNYTWWLMIWLFLMLFVILPWGGAWRY